MRRLIAVSLLGLAGCANFCDTFFRARNVCRDQAASQGVGTVVTPAPALVAAPTFACSSIGCTGCACSGMIVAGDPITTEVYANPIGCDCAGCAGGVVMSPPIVGEPVAVGSMVPVSNAGAVQTPSDHKPHPLLHPFKWMIEHHRNK